MMLLATLMLLDAAIARMGWLPYNRFPKDYLAVQSYLDGAQFAAPRV
jgi:hypothetical protein